jgi:threonine synthase
VLCDQRLELGDHVALPAELHVDGDPFLDRDEAKILEPPRLALRELLGGKLGQGGPAPECERVPEPKTIATAIKIGNPASWAGALLARDESKGRIEMVTDDEIVKAYRALADTEGVFVEPASAAPVAGLFRLRAEGRLAGIRLVVATLTGHGLKDPERAIEVSPKVERVEADAKALRRALLE